MKTHMASPLPLQSGHLQDQLEETHPGGNLKGQGQECLGLENEQERPENTEEVGDGGDQGWASATAGVEPWGGP